MIAEDDREGLERLSRYIARPPIASERLALRDDGRVVYRLRHAWRDGTTAVAFDSLTFIERLAALVPRPRAHMLTYHGVLAPAASWRDLVVPVPPPPAPSPDAEPRSPPHSKSVHEQRKPGAHLEVPEPLQKRLASSEGPSARDPAWDSARDALRGEPARAQLPPAAFQA